MDRLTAHAVRRAVPAGASAETVTLDYEGRFLRRRLLATDAGRGLLVDLPETVSLDDGDAFETTDGSLVAIRAAPEPLIEATAPAESLARLAWHVGNRHAPAQIEPGRLLIRADPVLGALLARLGATTRDVTEPFRPEGGAYGLGRTHGHHHGGPTDHPHEHDHGHDHGHHHGHAHD
jgi:urease accessory protein